MEAVDVRELLLNQLNLSVSILEYFKNTLSKVRKSTFRY